MVTFRHPIETFCCLNTNCAAYAKRGSGNLSFRGWSGKGKRIRMIYCHNCKKHISERKGTPLEGAKLPDEVAFAIFEHLREGLGTRSTSRLVGVHRDTVTRYGRKTGLHSCQLHSELVAFSPSNT